MPDQVKQLAFKEFTTTEISNGTRFDALTTNGTTHYVIKSIEATQGYNPDAVVADATIGLTTDFNNGKFASLGTVAKKDRVGLSGSAIMDANSTLSIRPVAKTISFRDQRFQLSRVNSSNNMNVWQQHNKPHVNNVQDSFVENTYINTSSVTHSGLSFGLAGANPDNYVVYHTNANGVNLAIYFGSGTSSGSYFELLNADTGSAIGYYSSGDYGQPHFDGERYIYFVRSGSYDHQVCFFDLDKSDLTPSATQGGSSGQNYFHGAYVYSGNQQQNSRSSYDHRRTAFYYDRYLNKKFLITSAAGNQRCVLYEIPVDTPTHDYNNVGPKWVTLSTSNHTAGTDPFGARAGSIYSFGYFLFQIGATQSSATHMKLTYDNDQSRYFIYLHGSSGEIWPFTFTRDEYNSVGNGAVLDQGPQSGYGLYSIAAESASKVGFDSSIYTNWGNYNGHFATGTVNTAISNAVLHSSVNKFYEGSKLYQRNYSSNYQLYEWDLSAKTATKIDTGLTDSQSLAAYNLSFFMSWAVPTSTQIAARSYNIVPGLTVRISGIEVDQ
tara:strand:- start:770 stop:2422 length:1653 start_codon:yes stop_codon:yes gene_type:complete